MTSFEVVLVSRTPHAAGGPLLAVVDRLVFSSLSYTDELNRPGTANVSAKVATLSTPVRDRLADLGQSPCEVWVYRDVALDWAGEVVSLQVQGQTVTLNCTGLVGYLARMGIVTDFTFTQVDQVAIARALVDAWQGQTFGNYGLDTTFVGSSGVLRDRTYLAKDQKDVLTAVSELGAVADGFDLHVDPAARRLLASYPHRGRDLTAGTILDARSIASANVAQSVAPDDLVTDVGVLGATQTADGASTSLTSYRENPAAQARYGRSWRGLSFNDVSEVATLAEKGDAFLAPRGAQLLQPGVTVRPNVGTGVTVGAIRPGDVVGYSYDAGLGVQSGAYRVGKVGVQVEDNGQQSLSLEFT